MLRFRRAISLALLQSLTNQREIQMTATISVQLYSVRNQLATNPEATLEQLAEIGFRSVEPFGLPEVGSLPRLLEQFSLSSPSAHGNLLGSTSETISTAKAMGIDLLIEPYQPASRFESEAAVRLLAQELTDAANAAAAAGITAGYHNHDHELTALIDGRPALFVLADLTPRELTFEVDLYWCQAAGVNAADVVAALGSRVVAIHAKDGLVGGKVTEQLPAGQGTVPISASRAAAPSALVVAEFDEYEGDIFEGLRQSFNYLSKGV
jgi:sugar phosphate isomerase/epimerase